nr:transposase [Streptomyces sp. NBC_00886]
MARHAGDHSHRSGGRLVDESLTPSERVARGNNCSRSAAVLSAESVRSAGHRLATPASRARVRLRTDLLATPGPLAEGRSLRSAAPRPARRTARGRRTRLVARVRGRLSRTREKGGAATGPSPVGRRKTGSKHHLICDGRGTPLRVITTAANVNDITQTLNLVDGIPPVAGRPGRPRRRPESVLGDKAYDSCAVRRGLRRRRILPVISCRGVPNIKGLGKLRYVVVQTFALLHQFKRLAVRCERRLDLHNAFVSLGCGLICRRRLKKAARP